MSIFLKKVSDIWNKPQNCMKKEEINDNWVDTKELMKNLSENYGIIRSYGSILRDIYFLAAREVIIVKRVIDDRNKIYVRKKDVEKIAMFIKYLLFSRRIKSAYNLFAKAIGIKEIANIQDSQAISYSKNEDTAEIYMNSRKNAFVIQMNDKLVLIRDSEIKFFYPLGGVENE